VTETLQVGKLVFEVRRTERRKTLGVTVDRRGELVAHAPSAASADELARWINKKLLWVYRKLALKREAAPPIRSPEYISGEAFSYLGRRFRLKLVASQSGPLCFDGDQFTLRRNARPAEDHFRRWYTEQGNTWLNRRATWLSRLTSRRPAGVEVRDLGYRWGSCTKSSLLLFNWKIMQLPIRLVDYIIVHELIHLEEPHHGSAFWCALDRSMPDWQDRKETLRVRAKDFLVFGLPAHDS
jgi:predicted metal-dependent hydrolase